jgi:hypothetical protein
VNGDKVSVVTGFVDEQLVLLDEEEDGSGGLDTLVAVEILGLAAVITGLGAVTSGLTTDDDSDLFTIDEGVFNLFSITDDALENLVTAATSGFLKERSLLFVDL